MGDLWEVDEAGNNVEVKSGSFRVFCGIGTLDRDPPKVSLMGGSGGAGELDEGKLTDPARKLLEDVPKSSS